MVRSTSMVQIRAIQRQLVQLLADIARLERLRAPQSVLRSLYGAKRRIMAELRAMRSGYISR